MPIIEKIKDQSTVTAFQPPDVRYRYTACSEALLFTRARKINLPMELVIVMDHFKVNSLRPEKMENT